MVGVCTQLPTNPLYGFLFLSVMTWKRNPEQTPLPTSNGGEIRRAMEGGGWTHPVAGLSKGHEQLIAYRRGRLMAAVEGLRLDHGSFLRTRLMDRLC